VNFVLVFVLQVVAKKLLQTLVETRYCVTAEFSWRFGSFVGLYRVGWQITLCDPIDKWRPVVLR